MEHGGKKSICGAHGLLLLGCYGLLVSCAGPVGQYWARLGSRQVVATTTAAGHATLHAAVVPLARAHDTGACVPMGPSARKA